MAINFSMLEVLADGRFHSGKVLGERFGISRAAIWKQVRKFAELGLEIQAVTGKGYRLSEPLELLAAQDIAARLSPAVHRQLAGLEVHGHIDSTNEYLKRQLTGACPSGTVCLAESQSQGRGRRGRQWLSPYGKNLYLSMLWRFPCGPAALSGLSLAIGVVLAKALRASGLAEIGVKWPNDLLVRGRKLAGILIDMSGEASGPTATIIGVGINLSMPAEAAAQLDQPWTDFHTATGQSYSRNQLAADVIEQLIQAVKQYETGGLAAFMTDWNEVDLTRDRRIRLQLPHQHITGYARGIDADGALLVDIDGDIRRFNAGEVSLRIPE